MPRDLGYRDIWQNCYFSTYGRKAAIKYGERFYCFHGQRYELHNNQKVCQEGICQDWYRCKGLDKAEGPKKRWE